jgi:LEA14-like dessication related protein
MKFSTIALLAVGAGAVYYFAQLGTAGATANFILQGVQVKSLTKLNIQILAQNVSNADIQLNALTANVAINGNGVGGASTFTPVDIAPRSQQLINLELDLSVLSLPSTIMSLINQTGNSYNFTVQGNANVNSLVVPFNLSQQITI